MRLRKKNLFSLQELLREETEALLGYALELKSNKKRETLPGKNSSHLAVDP